MSNKVIKQISNIIGVSSVKKVSENELSVLIEDNSGIIVECENKDQWDFLSTLCGIGSIFIKGLAINVTTETYGDIRAYKYGDYNIISFDKYLDVSNSRKSYYNFLMKEFRKRFSVGELIKFGNEEPFVYSKSKMISSTLITDNTGLHPFYQDGTWAESIIPLDEVEKYLKEGQTYVFLNGKLIKI